MRPLRKARKWTSRRLPSFGQILGWTCCWHRAYTPPSRQLRLRHDATALAATKMHSRPSKTGRAATFAPSARSISKLPRSARRQPVSARRLLTYGPRAQSQCENIDTPTPEPRMLNVQPNGVAMGGAGPTKRRPTATHGAPYALTSAALPCRIIGRRYSKKGAGAALRSSVFHRALGRRGSSRRGADRVDG